MGIVFNDRLEVMEGSISFGEPVTHETTITREEKSALYRYVSLHHECNIYAQYILDNISIS
jgi:hypothetical protein